VTQGVSRATGSAGALSAPLIWGLIKTLRILGSRRLKTYVRAEYETLGSRTCRERYTTGAEGLRGSRVVVGMAPVKSR
jgi:hypothetical protein